MKAVTRREFLRHGAVAAAAPYVITSAALGNAEKAAASERVTFAVIGLGDRGPTHLGMGGGAAQLVGVCDTWQDRRERTAERVRVPGYADFREILARDDIDAVVLAVPDHWHAPMAIRAANAGKDIYCEKALGISVAANQVIRILLGLRDITEITTSYRAFTKEAYLKIDPKSVPWHERSFIPVPVFLVRMLETGARVTEIPITMHPRTHGYSKMNYWKYIRDVLLFSMKTRLDMIKSRLSRTTRGEALAL